LIYILTFFYIYHATIKKYNPQQNRKYYQVNQYIKAPQIRVIANDGENLGVISLAEAQQAAKERGLDLVMVTENANPPVCRIIDFKKFRYKEQKKDQSGRKKGKSQDVKEVRFTPFIGKNDLDNRIKKIRSFLEGGDKVKLTVKFVGRQITRKDFGNRVIQVVLEEIEDIAKVESEPKLQGKILAMTVKPRK
jgi:translation initiation factor IF-3